MTKPGQTHDEKLAYHAAVLKDSRARQAQLKAALKWSEEDEAATLAHIRDLIGPAIGTIHAYGVPVLEVSYGKRFDVETAKVAFAAQSEILESISESKPSSALAKKVLPGALYDLCQRRSDTPTIKVVGQ